MKKLVKVVGIGLNVILVLLLIVVAGVNWLTSDLDNPWGLEAFTISSGSMGEAIPPGSFVLARSQDKYSVGDVVTYYSGSRTGELTTHRVIEISEGENLGYRTKGDANEDADLFITPASKVIGKVIYSVPYFGKFGDIATSRNGLIFFVVIPASILAYKEITNIGKEVKKMVKKKKKSE